MPIARTVRAGRYRPDRVIWCISRRRVGQGLEVRGVNLIVVAGVVLQALEVSDRGKLSDIGVTLQVEAFDDSERALDLAEVLSFEQADQVDGAGLDVGRIS